MARLVYVVSALMLLSGTCRLQATPSVSNLAHSASTIGQNERIELEFDVETVAQNPYWPYDHSPPASIPAGIGVTVDALFTNDNWATTLVVPAFYFQEYERHRNENYPENNPHSELYTPVGSTGWRVRFAPESVGQWKYKIRAVDAEGETLSSEGAFECIASTNPGFVRVSATDSRYFELSDGTALVGPGINGHLRSSYYADTLIKKCGDNGIKTVRYFMGGNIGYQHPFAGIGAALGLNADSKIAYTPDAMDGKLYSIRIGPGGYCDHELYLTAGTLYRVEVYVRTDALVGGGLRSWIGSVGEWENFPVRVSDAMPWTKITFDYTPTKTGFTSLWLMNKATSGNCYFDCLSMKGSTDNGVTWSSDFISKCDFDTHKYIDQVEAAEVDHIFEAAEANGVYLKTVITEKWDDVLSRIGADGSFADRDCNNAYAADVNGKQVPCRWFQQAWWRYMSARWGAYRSLHSWEFCNEGDPNNGNHWNVANALAEYVHSSYPRRILCTTSFYQGPFQAPLWKDSECDYMDSHDYIQTLVPGHGGFARIYASMDHLLGDKWNMIALPWLYTQGTVNYDTDVRDGSPGVRSLRGTTTLGHGSSSWLWMNKQYHIGVDPSHSYTLKYWVKGENVSLDPDIKWWNGGFSITWSETFHQNDPISGDVHSMIPVLGTYDWRQVVKTEIRPPEGANTANIYFRLPSNLDHPATAWIDDIEFIDNGPADGSDPDWVDVDLMVDGGFEGERMDYDIALGVMKFGAFYDSYTKRLGKPCVAGEVGIASRALYPNPYKGYGYTAENQALVDDTEGIHFRKFAWAHAGPYNPQMLYWWTELLESGNAGAGYWHCFKAFANFMAGMPISSGHYEDAKAVCSNRRMRAWGQKDLTNDRAYLWIDNEPYTWKAFVDHNDRYIQWDSTVTYYQGDVVRSADASRIYKSLKDEENVNHQLYENDWWLDLGAPLPNPPLPAPVSGTVTIPGLANGSYKAEWWDTATGQIIRTENVACTGGNIVLSVQNLQSDTACKIRPVAPIILLTISVPVENVAPGQTVTVTVGFNNAGEADAKDVEVKALVPAQMDYVAGSAETSGGVYDPISQSVKWVVPELLVGGSGTRTFQAKVR